MKRVGVALIVFLSGYVWPVCAQTPGTTSKSAFIDAVESNGNSNTTTNWRTIDGAYSKTKAATRELAITIRNMSALPGEFTIEWFFIGKPANGTQRFLYDKGEKPLTLAPNAFEKFSVESKELTSKSVRDYYWYGYNYKTGDRADGWIIRAKVGDEVVRVKASNVQLEQLEKNKEEFSRFIDRKK